VQHLLVKLPMRKIQSGQYKHVSLDERIIIYTLLKQGESVRDIARTLDRNAGTISRELKRNKTRPYIPYFPTIANEKAIKKAVSQRTKAPLKDPETYLYVRKKLREKTGAPSSSPAESSEINHISPFATRPYTNTSMEKENDTSSGNTWSRHIEKDG